jgi:glycosyltransferase involved in cell wall biosynthesis
VALAAGARVERFALCDDFAAARNAAIDTARGDWVLVIDADEQLASDAPAAIRAFVERGEHDAARIRIQNRTLPVDPLAVRVETSIRLFRRLPGVRYRGRVHEQIEPGLAAVGARVADAPIVIEHGEYAEPGALAARNRRNLRLLELAVAEAGGRVDGLLAFHHGLALAAAGRDAAALEALAMAVEPARGLDPALAAHAHARMAQIYLGRGDAARSRPHVEEAQAARGDDLFTRYVVAAQHYHDGEPRRAADLLRDLLEEAAGDGEDGAADAGARLRHGPVLLDLGDALAAAGDPAGALRAFTEAVRHLPDDPRPAARLQEFAQSRHFSRSTIAV